MSTESLTDEPSPLGAAATLPFDRSSRRRGDGRRQRARTTKEAGSRPASDRGYSGIEYVFEPDNTSRMPLRDYLLGVWERRAFIVEMAKAELRGSRANTFLGRLWSVLDPLFQAAIYFFLFAVIRGGRGRPIDFLPVLLAGVFLFSLMSSAMGEGGRSIRKSRSLMLNSTFPRAVLPIVTIYKGILGFIPSTLVIGLSLVLFGEIGWGLLAFPLLFAIQGVLSVGLALLLSTLIVFFRDASNFLNYILRILFFATPVIYPVELLGDARSVVSWQPLFPLFASYQAVFRGDAVEWGLVAQAVAWAAVMLVIGLRLFRRYEHQFSSRL